MADDQTPEVEDLASQPASQTVPAPLASAPRPPADEAADAAAPAEVAPAQRPTEAPIELRVVHPNDLARGDKVARRVTLDTWLAATRPRTRQVELLGAFASVERAAGHVVDTSAAYAERFAAFGSTSA